MSDKFTPGPAKPSDIPEGWEQRTEGRIQPGDLVSAEVPEVDKPVWWYSLVLRRTE